METLAFVWGMTVRVLAIAGLGILFLSDYVYYLHMFQLNSYFPERYRKWRSDGGKTVFRKFPIGYKIAILVLFFVGILGRTVLLLLQNHNNSLPMNWIVSTICLWAMLYVLGKRVT